MPERDNIIPFERPAGYWVRRARRLQDRDRLPEASAMLREAYRQSKDEKIALELAETNCGMGSYAAARRIAHGWYNGNAEYFVRFKTVFENIMPDYEYIGRRRRHSGRDFCGWGALAPVAIPAEWEISR